MKKIFLALTCMAGLTMMVACGGGNASKNTEATAEGETAAEQVEQTATAISPKDATKENYAEVIKSMIGVDFEVPESWVPTRVEGESSKMGDVVRVYFDSQDDNKEVLGKFLAACNEVTKQNNPNADTHATIDDCLDPRTTSFAQWSVTYAAGKPNARVECYLAPPLVSVSVPNPNR